MQIKVHHYENSEIFKPELISGLLDKLVLTSDEVRRLNRYYYHPTGQRKCSCCYEILKSNSENFAIKRYHKNIKGEISSISLNSRCKNCDKSYRKAYKRKQQNDPKLYCKKIISGLKFRAKEQGVAFKISGDELHSILEKQNFKCFYTGKDLDFTVSDGANNYPNRLMPSVDRLEPNKGYVVENIAWTLYFINRMKNDLNLEEFLETCQAVIKNTMQE